ncbi:amino acid ABC transporter permease [Paralcaligenes sp. KSB-10]|uniref:amino acid ABC transporter permease n=1 Tax=Paralcaligenes sp. KSB-10 TaxID=2901142 RepID=UPI001E656A4E|nr:amino acid ABC transporter permease [Paralcaligenes sp. KSB-10]UHL65699.1 amino acid ABC transporter permease [Paralcaligenes sp. KSB-10]
MNYTFNFEIILQYWPLIAQGLWTTVKLTALATVLGFIVGTALAYMRISTFRPGRLLAIAYIEIIRNTPLLIQAYFLIFGLASINIDLPILAGATIALVINVSAYTAEIMRAGIESIHKGQIEAAECLGHNRVQTFFYVVLAPSMERVYPSLISQYVLLMLASSILSAVGVDELFGAVARIQSLTFRNFEAFLVLGVIYLLLSFLVRYLFVLFGKFIFPRQRKLGTPL